ncbi:MAG: hypothetical protein WCH34_19620 [Bacteroidota bacterium]
MPLLTSYFRYHNNTSPTKYIFSYKNTYPAACTFLILPNTPPAACG